MTVPTRTEPCACGVTIRIDDPTSSRIASAMRRHVRSEAHQDWSGVRFHPCPGMSGPCGVTIPEDRDLCHFCSRTLVLMGGRIAMEAA